MRFLFILFLLLPLVSPLLVRAQVVDIQICNDEAGWPPFTFRSKADPTQLQGLSVELMNYVFEGSRFKAKLTLMPWSRCLGEAEKGGVDIAMDMYFSEERAKFVEYTEAYYQLSSSLYFMKGSSSSRAQVKSFTDMKKLKACGRREFDYSHFKLKNADFITMANSYEQLINLLKRERCDYFPEESEIMDGLWFVGDLKASKSELEIKRADWVTGPKIHWGVSKKSKYRDELLKIINRKIQELESNPETLKSWKKKYNLST